jgi:hypothetical protein
MRVSREQRYLQELTRAETHLRRIYRRTSDGVIEGECSAALGAMARARIDLGLAPHPEDTTQS